MSGSPNDSERPVIDRRPHDDEKPVIDRNPPSKRPPQSTPPSPPPKKPASGSSSGSSGSSSSSSGSSSSSSGSSSGGSSGSSGSRTSSARKTGTSGAPRQTQSGSGSAPKKKVQPSGTSYTGTTKKPATPPQPTRSRFLAAAAAIIAAFLLLLFLTRDTSVREFGKLLDKGEYQAAVTLYNDRIAGDQKKEEKVASDCETAIGSIRDGFRDGNISCDSASSALEALTGLANPALAEQARTILVDVSHIGDGQTLAADGRYADAIGAYLLVAPESSLCDAARAQAAACAQQLLDAVNTAPNQGNLLDMLNTYRILSAHPDFESQAAELETACIRSTGTVAEQLAQKDDHLGALKLVRSCLEVFPASRELNVLLTKYRHDYEQAISDQASALVEADDYVAALALVDQALADDPDNDVFVKLQQFVNEQRDAYSYRILDQVMAFTVADDYAAAYALIAQVRQADPTNTVFEHLEQSTLKSHEYSVAKRVQEMTDGGDYAGAISAIEQALKDCPGSQYFLDMKATVEAAREAHEKAFSAFTNQETVFIQHEGSISGDDDADTYTLTTTVAGYYRFDMANMVNGFKVTLYVHDSQTGEEKERASGLTNTGGITVYLAAGGTYTVKVAPHTGTGNYRLTIGQPKPIVDISQRGIVYDSLQYTDQRNWYRFTPEITGYYGFTLANMVNGFKPNMFIYDDLDYPVKEASNGISINECLTAYLEQGKTYEIQIRQYKNAGSYDLLIGRQLPWSVLEESTDCRSAITFKGQVNYYTFTAAKSGNYVFRLSGMEKSVEMNVAVIDSLNYVKGETDRGLAGGETIKVALQEGQTYTVKVSQYSGTGEYTLRAIFSTN